MILAAGDTFRAAAAEQLGVWGARSDVPVVKGLEGSDPGAVVFDAVKKAVADGADLVLCAHTAGRLHTQVHLMEELKKVKRVLEKALDRRARRALAGVGLDQRDRTPLPRPGSSTRRWGSPASPSPSSTGRPRAG